MSLNTGSDHLLVNLESVYRGRRMTPDRLGALLRSLSRRAGLDEVDLPRFGRHLGCASSSKFIICVSD